MPPLLTAEILAVGSELLGLHRIDTNSLFLTGRLNDIGIDVRVKSVVGDDGGRAPRRASAVAQSRRRRHHERRARPDCRRPDTRGGRRGARLAARGRRGGPGRRSAHDSSGDGMTMPAAEPAAGCGAARRDGARQPAGTAPGLWIEWQARSSSCCPAPRASSSRCSTRSVLPRLAIAHRRAVECGGA